MKVSRLQIIIVILFLLAFLSNAQSDTIFKKDGKVIPCTITLVNQTGIFFKDKKGFGEELFIKELIKYSQKGIVTKIDVPIDTAKGSLFIDNININALNIKYCELSGFDYGVFKSNIIIYVDYGQFISNPNEITIKNEKGKSMKFNSMIDALNFMESNGWEYIDQSINTGVTSLFGKNGSMYKYLLNRKMK